MKASLLLSTLAAGTALSAPQMTDRITPGEIAARQKISPVASPGQQVAGAEAEVARPDGQSFIKQSDILHDGTRWTIVPKGAVLHTPPAMAARVGARPLGTLLSWSDFLTANRAWLFTEEVTFDQASGKQPILPSRNAAWGKIGKVIVAVHQGGAISVRPEPATPGAPSK